jgi:hypothetical protein
MIYEKMNEIAWNLSPLETTFLISHFYGPFFSYKHSRSLEFGGIHRLKELNWKVLMKTFLEMLNHEIPLGCT